MKFFTRKNIILSGLILLFILSGFFREFLFLNINEQRRVTYDIVYRHENPESFVAPSMQWLSGFDYLTLTNLKWPLTLFFALYFAFLASRIIKILFQERSYLRITWFAYTGIFLLGMLFYLVGYLAGDTGKTYEIARFLAGLTEGPSLLIILIASFLVMKRIKS